MPLYQTRILYHKKKKNYPKKNKNFSQENSSYLFYVFWIIYDSWQKNKQRKEKPQLLYLEIKELIKKLKETWSFFNWNISLIYITVNYLIKAEIIQADKIDRKWYILKILDFNYYFPKKVLDLVIQKKLVKANYLRIYQFLSKLAIKNFQDIKPKGEIFDQLNSYNYFQKLNLDHKTLYTGIRWIIKEKLPIEFDSKIISQNKLSHVNLEKNTFFKGLKKEQEIIRINLIKVEKIIVRQTVQNVISFYSRPKFVRRIKKKIVIKIKKFFEYYIKRPCYRVFRTKIGWNYAACWCNFSDYHRRISQIKPKNYKYHRHKNIIIPYKKNEFEDNSLYSRLKKIKQMFLKYWFFDLKF